MAENFTPGLTSIIIPTRPRSKFASVKTMIKKLYLLTDALDDISNNVSCPFEIVIICNGNENDSFVDFIKNHSAITKYAILSTNVGITRGMNIGVEMAEGEFLCIANDDVEIGKNSIEKLIEILNKDGIGQVGLEGSMWYRQKPIEKVSNDKIREVDTVAGYMFIVKRTVYDLIGGMDTNYTPAFVEDIDISYAIRDAGYKCLAVPGLNVKHHHISGASSSNKPIKYMINKEAYRKDLDIRNLEYFEKKWEKYWSKPVEK